MMLYVSTRNAEEKVTASQAVLKGLAEHGGLFVPEEIPHLDVSVEKLADMSYQETAYEVMKLFLTDREFRTWSFFMEPPSPLRTWRCQSCRTF